MARAHPSQTFFQHKDETHLNIYWCERKTAESIFLPTAQTCFLHFFPVRPVKEIILFNSDSNVVIVIRYDEKE